MNFLGLSVFFNKNIQFGLVSLPEFYYVNGGHFRNKKTTPLQGY